MAPNSEVSRADEAAVEFDFGKPVINAILASTTDLQLSTHEACYKKIMGDPPKIILAKICHANVMLRNFVPAGMCEWI